MYTLHSIYYEFEYLCNISHVLVCVSNAEKNKLIKIYPEYQDKIIVIYNGISIPKNIHCNKNYLRSRKELGYIGRMDYRKGIYECLKEIKNLDVNLRIACAKNDEIYMEKVMAFIEGAELKDRIRFCGWCVGERKDSFYESLDALIVPSLYEPFGYVVLEAMRKGLIVICSKNGGPDEILEGYRFKYNPYVEGELEKMVLQFVNASNEEIKQQQQILIANLKRFTGEIMGNKYNKLWEKLMGK